MSNLLQIMKSRLNDEHKTGGSIEKKCYGMSGGAMSRAYIWMILVVLFLISGCSAFRSDKQTLNITCNVPDTILNVNGDRYNCPASIEVLRNKAVFVEARKTGYDTYTKSIDYHLNATGKLDIVGTILWYVPAVGLMNAGAWDLDQTELSVKLYPADKVKGYMQSGND